MPDGLQNTYAPMSPEALDAAERRALIAAVAEARADPRPAVPHEVVRAKMLRDLDCHLAKRRLAMTIRPVPA